MPAKTHRALFAALLILYLLALAPRLGAAAALLDKPIALDDMFQYDMLARSLNAGIGYRWYARADVEVLKPYLQIFLDFSKVSFPEEGLLTTFRAPGYPFFLAGIYKLAPDARIAAARLAQAGVGALLAPLVFLLALQLRLGRRAAWLAGLGMAFYPILVLYPVGLASENLFIPLLLAATLVLVWALDRTGDPSSPQQPKIRHGTPSRILIAGLLFGLAMLVRSTALAAVVLAGLAVFGRLGRPRRRAAGLTLLFLVVAFGVCLPWAVRNTLLMKKPTFVETSLGYNLFVGYHPGGDGGFYGPAAIQPLTIVDDAERDSFCTQSALEFIRQDPAEALRRVVRRAAYFVGFEDRELIYFYNNNHLGFIPQPWLSLAYLLLVIPWVGTAVFTLAGLGLAFSNRRQVHFYGVMAVAAVALAYSLPHLFIIAEPRFHLAIVPLLLPLAAHGWLNRKQAWGMLLPKPNTHRAMRLLVWAILAALVTFWVWSLAANWNTLLALMGPGGNKLFLPY